MTEFQSDIWRPLIGNGFLTSLKDAEMPNAAGYVPARRDEVTVSPQTLVGKKLVRKRGRTIPAVKVLADGTLSKRLTFSNVSFSASARSLVAASGSTIA